MYIQIIYFFYIYLYNYYCTQLGKHSMISIYACMYISFICLRLTYLYNYYCTSLEKHVIYVDINICMYLHIIYLYLYLRGLGVFVRKFALRPMPFAMKVSKPKGMERKLIIIMIIMVDDR